MLAVSKLWKTTVININILILTILTNILITNSIKLINNIIWYVFFYSLYFIEFNKYNKYIKKNNIKILWKNNHIIALHCIQFNSIPFHCIILHYIMTFTIWSFSFFSHSLLLSSFMSIFSAFFINLYHTSPYYLEFFIFNNNKNSAWSSDFNNESFKNIKYVIINL